MAVAYCSFLQPDVAQRSNGSRWAKRNLVKIREKAAQDLEENIWKRKAGTEAEGIATHASYQYAKGARRRKAENETREKSENREIVENQSGGAKRRHQTASLAGAAAYLRKAWARRIDDDRRWRVTIGMWQQLAANKSALGWRWLQQK